MQNNFLRLFVSKRSRQPNSESEPMPIGKTPLSFYYAVSKIKKSVLRRWLKKAAQIQWDYKNIVKRKGRLVKLKGFENASENRN